MKNAIPNGRGVSGSFYKNVILKKIANKKEREKDVQKPVSSMSICYMTMLQPTNLQL